MQEAAETLSYNPQSVKPRDRSNLIGRRFGRLTVVRQVESYISPKGCHQTRWLCKCDCGSTTTPTRNSLNRKSCPTLSCGCIADESRKIPRPRFTEGQAKVRFWARVDILEPDQCWPWKGGLRNKCGYGGLWVNGVQWRAHRFAYFIFHGRIDPDLVVMHSCDNPKCCNPAHLSLGTNADNTRDCIAKGRDKREKGEDRYNARLTEDDVRTIRALYQKRSSAGWNGRKLARRFGVYPTMIHAIVSGRRWKHVK